ncbi:MAG: choice-of-anchor L domain-containing protein [Proteobacteria bacterium]|jgi:hypothetical protein|nr:choice-of-anchor L domain-containing protein [Pseudomonadota bacterium]
MTARRRILALAFLVSAAWPAGCGPDRRDVPEDEDTDTDTDPGCDCGDLDETSAADLAAAMNLCPGAYLDAVSLDMTSSDGLRGFGIAPQLGTSDCLEAPHRCVMLAISTGPLDEENPNFAEDMGDDGASTDLDPQPEYQGGDPATGDPAEACDRNQLRVTLTVPEGKQGFSFDFLFASAEYDEFLNFGFNDTFYAIMEYDALNDGATTNIAFDDAGNEIEVDAEFFENDMHPCSETGSHWSQTTSGNAGSTGWLRTSWPVAPGDTFNLTFSIHDELDNLFDSIVLLDRFRWLDEAPTGVTVPIE